MGTVFLATLASEVLLMTLVIVSLAFGFINEETTKTWIAEFPPIPGSAVNTRSVSIGYDLSQLDLVLSKLSETASTKVYIEVRPENVTDFIRFLNVTQFLLKNVRWMPCIVLYWPNNSNISLGSEEIVLDMVQNISTPDFPLQSEVYVAFTKTIKSQQTTNYALSVDVRLCDLFNFKLNTVSLKKMCNSHNFAKPLFELEDFFSYHVAYVRRRDLSGSILNVVAQFDPDYQERLSIGEADNGAIEFTSGMCLDILRALQFSMNFRYVAVKGDGWVGVLPNGSWTGMAAQLIYDEADLSIAQASMVMMTNQLEGISFLHASSTGTFVALFRQPKASLYRNLLTSALSTQCWMFYLITWVITVLMVYSFLLVQWNLTQNDLSFIREVLLWAIKTICVTGWYRRPSSASMYIICLVASCLSYCVYIAYSAELTVALVTEVLPIRNFQQLSSSSLEVFTDKWLPVARSLIEKIYNQRGVQIPNENSDLYTIAEGLPKVMYENPSTAFVTFTDAVSTVFHRMNLSDYFFCSTLSSVSIASERSPAGMFVRRGSPLKEVLNYNTLMMTESGILSRLNKQYDLRTQILCLPSPNNYRGGLSLEDIWTPFFVLTAGFCMCIFNFFLEYIYWKSHASLNTIFRY